MRLDVFLKVSRLVKRRPLANELCDAGRVLLNGAVVRAAHQVKPQDVLEIHGDRTVRRVRVVAVPEGQQTKADAARLVELISEEPTKLLDFGPSQAARGRPGV
jgi:ribosomal 50S subunit-recycling heat shock protein